MNFSELLRRRRSIRFYRQMPVAEEHLLNMIAAACHAPSAANNQVLRYTVVRNADLVQAIFYHTKYAGRVTPKRSPQWGVNAPAAFICVSAVKNGPVLNPMVYADAGAAVMSMAFQAVEEKLGTCWIGAFNAKEVSEIVELDPAEQLIYLVAVGHPAEKPVEDIIENGESVAYYIDSFDTLHVPKYSVKAITRIL